MTNRTGSPWVVATAAAAVLTFAVGITPAAAAAPAAPQSPPATNPAGRAAPPLAPPQSEIDADFDAGRYDAVLRKVRAALEQGGPAAKAYDRAALLRTRGEALLRTKQGAAAARAFEDAADEAEDRAARAEALATAALVRRSNVGLLYVGRRPGGGDRSGSTPPIDVADPANRKAGFAALFADELAARRGRVEAVAAGTSVKEVLGLMPILRELGALELAATGRTETVDDLSTGLDARFAAHLDGAVAALAKELEGHAAHATAAVPLSRTVQVQRGLGSRAGRVAEIARLADDLRRACVRGEDLFPGTDRDFAGLRQRAERTRNQARDLLGRDYSEVFAKQRRNPADPQARPTRSPDDPGPAPGPGRRPPPAR